MRIRAHDPWLSFDYRSGEKVLSFFVDREGTNEAEQAADEMCGIPLVINVERFREKRSLSANAYTWVLIDKIAKATNLPPADVYRHAIREIAGVSEAISVSAEAVDTLRDRWSKNGIGWFVESLGQSDIDGRTDLLLYYGSSTYDTSQMSRLIDCLVQEAKSIGIETLPPAELERMVKSWEERERRR